MTRPVAAVSTPGHGQVMGNPACLWALLTCKPSRPAQILVGGRAKQCRARSSGAVRVRNSGPYGMTLRKPRHCGHPSPMQSRHCLIPYLVRWSANALATPHCSRAKSWRPAQIRRGVGPGNVAHDRQGPFASVGSAIADAHHPCTAVTASRALAGPAHVLAGRRTRQCRARSSGAVRVRNSGPYGLTLRALVAATGRAVVLRLASAAPKAPSAAGPVSRDPAGRAHQPRSPVR